MDDFGDKIRSFFIDFSDKEILYGIEYQRSRICSAVYASQKREGDTTMTRFKGKWICDNCGEKTEGYRVYCNKCKKNNITIP